MTINDIKEAIENLFGFTVFEETPERITFTVFFNKTAFLDKNEVNQIIAELAAFNIEQDVELFDDNSYEVLIRNGNRILFTKDRVISQNDTINKIDYKIDKPTNKFLIFFLFNLGRQNTPKILRNAMIPQRAIRIFETSSEPELTPSEYNILDIIKDIVPRLKTLKILSEKNKKESDFEQLVYAFLFNLGYNLDYTFQPLRFMDEFTQPYKIGELRRGKLSELEPPKRLYTKELILHYQKGISSESIDHQFLSFYHVLEHFYEKIYNDDILKSIKNELTKPSFSYKRDKDITNLISVIQNRLKYKNDEFQLNELEALELTLKRFVNDLSYLANELTTISPTLLEHFKTTEVPFSKGNKVNFENVNTDEIYRNLARRIYLTRNSIVHSKETDKIKYIPFRDDKYLLTEIYLLRLIAEIVIIDNSKVLYW